MKNYRSTLCFGIIFLFLIASCGKKVDSSLKVNIEGATDFEKLTGIWVNERKGVWMELRADSTYDQGKGKELKAENQPWKVNEDKKELTLNSERGWFKFTYRIEPSGVFFKPDGKDKEAEFVKVKQRPE
jgi:hypothetical protein